MKQSLCFQLRNRSLWKFKSSYVTAEAAVQQPPKQAAVPHAAFPEMSWLCASVCPSTEEEQEEAWPAQKVFQGMPVDGLQLHNRAWELLHSAQCLPAFQGGKNRHVWPFHGFKNVALTQAYNPLHLGMQRVQGEVSAISQQLLAQGLCLAGVSCGMSWQPQWGQQDSVATTALHTAP